MEIVTGSTGEVHVTPIDDAVRNSNVGYLSKKVVFTCFDNFEARAITNNEVRIYSGYGINQGRIFKIDDEEYDSVTIENGSQGYKRADLIVARYTMDTQTGFEDISLVAIRGTSGSSYVDPSYTTGNINEGATQDDFPLYRVKLNGLTIAAVERLFTLVPDGGRMGELEAKVTSHINTFNALNFRTNLASESTIYPKNGANVRPGVEGTLPASHGGTGQTTLKDSASSLSNALDTNAAPPADDNYYIGTTPSTGTTYHRKPLSALWSWILSHIRTQLGMSATDVVPISHGGTGKTSIGNGKVIVGNSSGEFDELGIDSAPSLTSNNLITSKGVAESLSTAGYGDMMRATYDPNQDGIIAPENGGTGQTSLNATRNALGLGDDTTQPVPIPSGGTGLNTSPSMLTNLGSTAAASVLQASPRPGVTGTLTVAHGGTGMTTNPSMLTNLGSTTAANVLQTSPRPGITGTLTVAHGGTGLTTNPSMLTNLGSTTAANVLQTSPRPGVTGTLPVANGGTGATSASAARTNLGTVAKAGDTFTGSIRVDRGGSDTDEHWTRLYVGNEKAVGTAGNQVGVLALYAANGKQVDLVPSSNSAEGSVRLPATTGTLALTSQLASYMPKTGGTFTGVVEFNKDATFGTNSNVNIRHFLSCKEGNFDELIVSNSSNDAWLIVGDSEYNNGHLCFRQKSSSFDLNISTGTKLTDERTVKFPNSDGTIQVSSPSSRRIKENIKDMSEDKAKKLLEVNVVDFDYIGEFGGGLKNQCGVIAEDTLDIIPEAVEIEEGYDETKPVDAEKNPAPSVDYRKFIPYLIKMVQIQQHEIEELKSKLS